MNAKCPNCGSQEISKNGFKRGIQRYICRSCGRYFSEHINVVGKKNILKKAFIIKSNKNMGITEDQLRQKHDVVYILSQVFTKIEAEEETVFYEKSDIIKRANLSPGYPGISTVLESEDFKKYSGRAGSVVYWGKPEAITKLKEEGIMR